MEENYDLITGIAAEAPEHPQRIEVRDFAPWHKPRKQYIRGNQWIKEITTFLDANDLEGRPFKYFSLPGDDMIDLCMLAEECQRLGVQLRVLGFNEDLQEPIGEEDILKVISRSEISAKIAPGSYIRPDDFKDLSNSNSMASNYVCKFGSFDVINLDFCDSIFNRDYQAKHDALHKLITNQIQNRTRPWLLFLTTRSDTTEDLGHYWKSIYENFDRDPRFIENFRVVFEFSSLINNDGLKINPKLISNISNHNFTKLFGIGFSKWILNMLMFEQPYFIVEMLDSYWYRVDNEDPNMLSLAYRISRHPEVKEDPSGLVPSEIPDDPDEYRCALRIMNKVHHIKDLDQIVDEDDDLFNGLTDETKQFLSPVRYRLEDYPAWANQKRIRF